MAGADDANVLPPLFAAAPGKMPPASQKSDPRPSLVSERVQRLISHAVFANTGPLLLSNSAVPEKQESEGSGAGALLMEKVVVNAPVYRDFVLRKPLSPLDRFRKHGVLFESVGQRITFDTMLYIDRWYSNRQGSGGTETRAELKFNFRW